MKSAHEGTYARRLSVLGPRILACASIGCLRMAGVFTILGPVHGRKLYDSHFRMTLYAVSVEWPARQEA